MSQTTESCCGPIYEKDAVRILIGDSWHPGGLTLTGQIAYTLGIRAAHVVLDAACGVGASANFLAKEFACRVIGVDISTQNIREASRRAPKSAESNDFIAGDSLRFPLADESIEIALLECTLSSFSNKEELLHEIYRVLKKDAKLGISDVILSGNIPEELRVSPFQELCVSYALPLDNYCELLEHSGFKTLISQIRRSEALEFIESIKKKLFLAQLLVGVGKISVSKEGIEYARHLAALSKKAIEDGKLGYATIVAQKVV